MTASRLHLGVDAWLLEEDWALDAGPEGLGVWLTAALLAKQRGTDGAVRRALLLRNGVLARQIDELVAIGGLQQDSDGDLMVVGFLAANLSQSELDTKRSDDAARQRRSRERSQRREAS